MGEGRFGTVFEAEFSQKAVTDKVDGIVMKKCKKDKNSTKPIGEKEKIAVKMLKKKSVIDQDAVMQIIEEIRIHSVCSGLPHVLKFFKAWQTERHLFVALSLCQRGSLADLFRLRKVPFSSQSVILAANQLYQGEEKNSEVFKTKLKVSCMSPKLLRTYSRKQREYNGTIIFEIDIMKTHPHSI